MVFKNRKSNNRPGFREVGKVDLTMHHQKEPLPGQVGRNLTKLGMHATYLFFTTMKIKFTILDDDETSRGWL